jgi:hypothetical protein
MTTMQLAIPGASLSQSASQLLRSSDGKLRMDYGNTSVITNPAAQQAILLDHIKLVAKIIPIPPQLPQLPKIPQIGIPGPPGAPTPPPMSVVNLGPGSIEGHAVMGQQITFHMPTLPTPPKIPGMPQLPGMPKLPGMPSAPGAPQAPGVPGAPGMPKPPAMPTIAEVWTSSSLHLPVLTKITGSFGQRNCYCKNAPTGEPHPSSFQIPAGYKLAV